MNPHSQTPIDFDAVVAAALAKQASLLKQERNNTLNEQAMQFNKVLAKTSRTR
jgi:hypothetical protein